MENKTYNAYEDAYKNAYQVPSYPQGNYGHGYGVDNFDTNAAVPPHMSSINAGAPGPGAYAPAPVAFAPIPVVAPPSTICTSTVHPEPENEVPNNFGASFSDKNIRRIFVRKVYSILLLQLLVTFAIVALFIFEPNVKNFVRRNVGFYIAAYWVFLVTYITLICCPNVRRKYPGNLICLAIFTLALSYLTGVISSQYETQTVFFAVGMCAGVTLSISLLSMWTKFDFTGCGAVLWIMCLTLFFFGIFAIFTYNNILYTVYSALAALLLMMLLAYHTQLIIGGKRYSISPEEHIVAALVLYLDVVQLFWIILGLSGRGK